VNTIAEPIKPCQPKLIRQALSSPTDPRNRSSRSPGRQLHLSRTH